MTAENATADVREVILATIRERLLDDGEILRTDADDDERHMRSIAEHALDAALARGASLHDVHAAAAAELARTHVEGYQDQTFDPDGSGMFDPSIDHLADLPFKTLGLEPPEPDAPERTLNDLRRSQTLRLVYMLVNKIGTRAFLRVRDVWVARVRELGLDDAPLGEMVDARERAALFTAGLYGEEVPAA
jgi:hypothetical protein